MTVELTVGAGEDERTLIFSVIPVPIGGESTYFWVGTDVSDLRRLNVALEKSQKMVEAESKALEEYAVALKVILEQSQRERLDLEQGVQDNLELLITPNLDRLERSLTGQPERYYVQALRQALGEITRDGERRADWRMPTGMQLTRRELEIARLVRMGRSTDEIASILHLSPGTVSFHRKKIRRKLGLSGHKTRLAARLQEPRTMAPNRNGVAGLTEEVAADAGSVDAAQSRLKSRIPGYGGQRE